MANLRVNSSPHIYAKDSTQSVMLQVIIALVPALVASIILFGIRAFVMVAVCVLTCVLSEYIYRKLMHQSFSISDLSAVITGMLLAFNLPVDLPFWMAVIGSVVAIIVVKQLFGGLGKNFANPALVGRIVLLLSFATPMTTWSTPITSKAQEVVSGATPLVSINNGVAGYSYTQLFIGNIGGSLGETCKLAILIGGIYLIYKKVITATIPVTYILTVFIFSSLLGVDGLAEILSGGLFLGAFFMATDYVTSPTTESGKLVYGIGCGIITVVIRLYGSNPEGVSFAILLMNIITPHICRLTRLTPLGGASKK